MESYQLQSDLLAKGMTKTAKILWVPFSLALANVGMVFMLSMFLYVLTSEWRCLILALGITAVIHLILALWSMKDDRAVILSIKDRLLCDMSGSSINRYSPFALHQFKNLKESFVEQHIPYSCLLNDHSVMTARGDVLQVLTLSGIPFDAEMDSDIDSFKHLRNRLMYQIANPNIALYFYHARNKVNETIVGEFPNEFASSFVEQLNLKKETYYRNDLYIVLIRKGEMLKGRAPFNKNNEKDSHLVHALSELDALSLRIEQLFSRFTCIRLNHETKVSLSAFLARTINHRYQKISPVQGPLKRHLSSSHLRFGKQKGIVELTDTTGAVRYLSLLSFKEYPEETHASLLDLLLAFPAELSISQSFLFQSASRAVKELKVQQRKLDKTDDSVILADALEEGMEALKAGRTAFGSHHFSVALIADSLEELQRKTERLDAELNQKAELLMLRETKGVELAFFAQMPGNFSYRIRHGLIGALNMASFASLHNYPSGKAFGNHWGHSLVLLETLAGTPYHFNFHVGQVGNSILIGPMGSGKTLLLGAFLILSNKYGGFRYVFDKDRGMEPLVRAMGSDYRVLLPGIPSGMAPLQLEDTVENRAFNILLLKKILSLRGALNASEEKVIERAVNAVYTLPSKERTYSNLAPFFGVADEGSLRERFDRWCGSGSNAWLFDNPVDVFSIDNKISGQDIGNLLNEQFSETSTPALMYIFHRLGNCLDSSPTLVLIPEGWKALSDSMFRAQLLDWSKTPRKNNMALIIDTQNPRELSESSAGCALVQEAVTQIFFAHAKAEWADYQKFNLNEKEFFIIREILPVLASEHYFLLKQGGNSLIVRLNLKELEQFIPVLSGSKGGNLLMDALRVRLGEEPRQWLSAYQHLSMVLKKKYGGDFKKMELRLEEHLKECVLC